jgi:segregation and condensation protein A
MEQIELPYQVRLASFEGPLDLLLHLIKKSEINIYEIPIALITQQYLDYLTMMKALNLAVAGEFLVMAATLVHIKSRMLLPDEGEDTEEDGPDPREELVQRLLEYRRYKEAAGQLNERERFWRDLHPRGLAPEAPVRPASDDPLADLTLFDLVDALQEVLARAPSAGLLEIEPENLTVKDRMNVILDRLEEKESLTFLALFEEQANRLVIIVTFLALLELTRLRLIRVFQGESFGPILITRTFESVGVDDPAEVEPLT